MPLDYVAACAPGRSYTRCIDAVVGEHGKEETITSSGHGGVFPANDLVDISLLVARLAEGGGASSLITSNTASFRHAMEFRDGYGTVRTRVMDLMRRELGPATNTGRPPIADPMVQAGDFWIVEDGIWILSDRAVLWYSKPFTFGNKPTDTYVRPAPRSTPVWLDVGRLLVTY